MFEAFKKLSQILFPTFTLHSLEEEVKEEVAKECGINKNELPEVEFKPLPLIAKITNYGKIIIGKIAGVYDTIKHKIYIDPLHYLFSNTYERVKLLAEELYHAADNLKGKLKNKYRSFQEYLENYENDEDEIRAKIGAEKIARKIANKYGDLGYLSLYI
jgi:DNA-directed RNA polymerase subunit H (RpoH/RPB5)